MTKCPQALQTASSDFDTFTLPPPPRRTALANQMVMTEQLNSRGVVKNHSLARAISDASWGELNRQLAYKALWHGRHHQQVAAPYTSMDCSAGGYRNRRLTLAVREWACPGCGCRHDKDANAAVNIKQKAVGQTVSVSARQEGQGVGRNTAPHLRTARVIVAHFYTVQRQILGAFVFSGGAHLHSGGVEAERQPPDHDSFDDPRCATARAGAGNRARSRNTVTATTSVRTGRTDWPRAAARPGSTEKASQRNGMITRTFGEYNRPR